MNVHVRLNWQVITNSCDLDDHSEFLSQDCNGLYVWIWPGNPARIFYIGETGNFSNRFTDHMSKMLGGEYTVFHMDKNDDFVEFAKKHYAGKTIDEINSAEAIYIPTISIPGKRSFSRAFFDETRRKKRMDNLQLHRYAFATVENGDRKEVEGALISLLRKQYEKHAGPSLQRGDSRVNQTLVGNINKYPTTAFTFEHTGAAASELPQEFLAITCYDCPKDREYPADRSCPK